MDIALARCCVTNVKPLNNWRESVRYSAFQQWRCTIVRTWWLVKCVTYALVSLAGNEGFCAFEFFGVAIHITEGADMNVSQGLAASVSDSTPQTDLCKIEKRFALNCQSVDTGVSCTPEQMLLTINPFLITPEGYLITREQGVQQAVAARNQITCPEARVPL